MTRKRHKTQYPGIYYRFVNDRPEGPRRYIVMFTDGHGRLRSETLSEGCTLEDARARKAQLTISRARGEALIGGKLTVGELLDQWLEQRKPDLKPATVEAYTWAIESHLKPRFERVQVKSLSATNVAGLISDLKAAGLKTWTVKKILTPLTGAYKVAIREGVVSSCPTSKLLPHERPRQDQREMRCLSGDEIKLLLQHASSERWRTLFAFLVFTGLRIGEALALTWDDIDLQGGYVSVRQSKTRAGVRDVILIPSLVSRLRRYRLQQVPGAERLFSNGKGGPIPRREALRALRAAEKRAGLVNYTLHELRHTFASILIGQRELPTLVAAQMGHADPAVTMKTYAHLFEAQESVEQARERLEAGFGGSL